MKQLPPGVVLTSDGSYTLRHDRFDVTYHSIHGAVQESMHVFIAAGLLPVLDRPGLSVFEFGFGSGLNLMLTAKALEDTGKRLTYHAIDIAPPTHEQLLCLNYPEHLERPKYVELLKHIGATQHKTSTFNLGPVEVLLEKTALESAILKGPYDLVYYDAFAPSAQPDLWTIEALGKIARSMRTGGILVTYCAQGQFKRNLKALGFTVDSIPGPPGKREMVRATLGAQAHM